MKIVSRPPSILNQPAFRMLVERILTTDTAITDLFSDIVAGMTQDDLLKRLADMQDVLRAHVPDDLLTVRW